MSEPTRYFNIDEVAQRYRIDIDLARKLLNEARQEFDNDEMMAELHTIRAIRRLATREQKKAS